MRNPTASGARELGNGGDGVAPARQGHGSHVTEGWVAPEGHVELRGAHVALTCAVGDATASAGLRCCGERKGVQVRCTGKTCLGEALLPAESIHPFV